MPRLRSPLGAVALAGLAGAVAAHLLMLAIAGRDAQTESVTPFAIGVVGAAALGLAVNGSRWVAAAAAGCALVLIYVLFAAGVLVGFYSTGWGL
jgi:hypothetical protein